MNNEDELMTPAEVADIFKVDPKTVTRWAKAGKLSTVRTVGGHRRYYRQEVMGIIAASRENRQAVRRDPA